MFFWQREPHRGRLHPVWFTLAESLDQQVELRRSARLRAKNCSRRRRSSPAPATRWPPSAADCRGWLAVEKEYEFDRPEGKASPGPGELAPDWVERGQAVGSSESLAAARASVKSM
jgi:hypothetical protein